MNTKELNQTILESLNWRYATKVFDQNKKITEEDWSTLKESLRLSPSSFGLQPWQFIEVISPEILKKLAEAAPLNKAKFDTASRILILSRLKTISHEYMDNYLSQLASEKGIPRERLKGYEEAITAKANANQLANWSALQTYIPLGGFLTVASLLRIDACAMEGIDPAKFDEILGLNKTDYGTIVGLAAGYRSAEDKTQFSKKVRHESSVVFKVV